MPFLFWFDTYSGSLDFELAKISILEDDKSNRYNPLNWEGSPPGGHHRSGILSFPPLIAEAKKIKLIIEDCFVAIINIHNKNF